MTPASAAIGALLDHTGEVFPLCYDCWGDLGPDLRPEPEVMRPDWHAVWVEAAPYVEVNVSCIMGDDCHGDHGYYSTRACNGCGTRQGGDRIDCWVDARNPADRPIDYYPA